MQFCRTLVAFAISTAMSTSAGAGLESTRAQGVAPAADLQGKLYRSVFSAGVGSLKYEDLANAPQELRTRLARYLSRRSAFKSGYRSGADSFDAVRVEAKRRMIEQAIVALIETPGIERLATEYVSSAPISYEWKGMHHGPMEESAHAEALLAQDPSTPLAPWFSVFIAHRQRAAFEAYEVEKNREGMRAAARKYRMFLERSQNHADPIFPALAADLDRQPFVYIRTSTHPRDYNSGA